MSAEVIISGGGMVGATLACALAGKGRRVAVAEAHEPQGFEPDSDFDLRVSAISPASEQVFRQLGVWPLIARRRLYAYRRMHVWDAVSGGAIDFDALELGEPRLGHIIENRVIQDALLERLRGLRGVQWRCPARVSDYALGPEGIEVTLERGESLAGRLLVGADGPASKVRHLAGIRFRARDYGQAAVVANVHTQRPMEATAWQCFLPTGPLAFLPLAEHVAAIVWSTTFEEADRLVGLADEAFRLELETAFQSRLGSIERTSRRVSFPLRGGQAEPYVVPRIALVGDAAHTIHPLAGQGANLGIMDAATLAEVLVDSHRDPGSLRVLRRYERARKGDNLLTMRAMEGFRYLFAGGLRPLAWIRGTGLSLTNAVQPVKHLLMRHAMGLAGERPRLARGLPL